MPRTPAVTVPNSKALPSANSAPIWNVSLPGLVTINTPRNPTTSATHRAAPIGSLRNTSEASAANSGAREVDRGRAGERHHAERDQQQRLRGELRHAAQHVGGRPARVQHGPAGGRQGECREQDQRDEDAAEQHLADRIGRDQPFRGGAGEREDHARRDHVEDRLRNPLLPRRRLGDAPFDAAAAAVTSGLRSVRLRECPDVACRRRSRAALKEDIKGMAAAWPRI